MLKPTFGICEWERRGYVKEHDPRPFSEQLKSAYEEMQEAERAAAEREASYWEPQRQIIPIETITEGDLETESGGKSCLQVLASFLPIRKKA